MLRRFAAATAIASVAITVGALGMLLSPALAVERVYPLVILWCFVPLVWGLWAMCTPARWFPERLPNWGAVLGLLAGLSGAFVLDVPSQIAGRVLSFRVRFVAVGLLVALYYVAWMFVRIAYGWLAPAFATKFKVNWIAADQPRLWQARETAPISRATHPETEVAQHVAEARELLQQLRDRPERHADLDEAIEKLEMALSALTIKTGGLL